MALDLCAMQEMQHTLQAKYKGKWPDLCPAVAREKLLWMLIEAGEAADVIKKAGDDAIMENREARQHFIEEMCDTLMYFNDVCLCYGITPEEIETSYRGKHDKNMTRW